MSSEQARDVRLANGWPVSKVVDCIERRAQGEIIQFLRVRYNERFFDPLRHLTRSRNKQGYGFAIMALCSLLIETIQCYRYGLPSTHGAELKTLGIPKAEWKNGAVAFKDFFLSPQNQGFFQDVDGAVFYSNIRNGLLHQAQTKGGWTIRADRSVLCDPVERVIDRDKFSAALKKAFDEYLADLERHDWTDDIWSKAVQKLRWLIKMSSDTSYP